MRYQFFALGVWLWIEQSRDKDSADNYSWRQDVAVCESPQKLEASLC